MERSSPRLSDSRLQRAWAEVHDSREAFNNGAPPLRLPSQGQDAQLIPGGSIPSCYYRCWPTIRSVINGTGNPSPTEGNSVVVEGHSSMTGGEQVPEES